MALRASSREATSGMDHLSDGSNKFTFPDQIPLFCNSSFLYFDGQERNLNHFIQLPEKLGWTIHEDGNKTYESSQLTLDGVMQRWLYFEVLAQVFGHLPGYQGHHFIKEEGNDICYITTVRLARYIKRWLASEEQSPDTVRNRRLIRIQQVLDIARVYVSQHCTAPNLEANPTWEIRDVLALSLLVLGETLTRALKIIQSKVGLRIDGWCDHDSRNRGWGYSKKILQMLKEALWCAKAIHRLKALLRGNTIGLLYLYTLRKSSFKGEDHKHCTAAECKEKEMNRTRTESLESMEPEQYHHCSAEISGIWSEPSEQYVGHGETSRQPVCRKCHIDGGDLAAIIDRGNIPLFRFHKDQSHLELVEMSHSINKTYTIFPHVWTDGFASSSDKNEMNLCVLKLFSNMLERTTLMQAGNTSSVPKLFWIDTLAIPTHKEFPTQRIKALRQMHKIYACATSTIVIDLGLMRVTMGSGYSNTAMKITMSRWMTRLWTLQEAVLSRNLFFCFLDGVCSMRSLEDLFAREDSELHSCVPSLCRTYYDGILGEVRKKIHKAFQEDVGWNPRSDILAAVWKATQWRSTTHLTNETLSLATMLNVHTDIFAGPNMWSEESEEYQQACDERMITLLYNFATMSTCPIPAGMIFLPGPRLSRKGYGWAPRTWLSSHEIDSPDPLSLPSIGNTRLTESHGLEVQYPGFLLHDLGDSRDTLNNRENFFFSADSTLLDWYRVEPAQDTMHFPKADRLRGRGLAIILSRLPIVDLKEIGLFVAIESTLSNVRYAEILNRVWIRREVGPKIRQAWTEKHREGLPEAISAGEKLSPSTKWCVDGPVQPDAVLEEGIKERNAHLPTTNSPVRGLPRAPEEREPRMWPAFNAMTRIPGFIKQNRLTKSLRSLLHKGGKEIPAEEEATHE